MYHSFSGLLFGGSWIVPTFLASRQHVMDDDPCRGQLLEVSEQTLATRAGMLAALALAEEARDADEVPIGAAVVLNGALIGLGRNECRARGEAIAHAEMLALHDAFRRTGHMRLPGATVFTTVEPCFMCAGALSHARVARVVWAVRDPKFGACASLAEVLGDTRLNHTAEVHEGVFAAEAKELMQSFFRAKRASSDPRGSAPSPMA